MDHGQRTSIKQRNIKKTCLPQSTIPLPRPKVSSVQFYDLYDHIHHMEHTHEDTHPIDTQEQDIENNEVENTTFMKRKMMT